MDSGAFAYCSNLSTLIIPSGLTSLSTLNEGSIFEGSGIKAVYVAWQAPVPAGQFFYGFDVSQSTLYVPQGTRQDYWVAAVWEDFGDIQEYDVSAVNWRKRSIPTHSGWLYPLTFDAEKGLKEA